MSYYPTTLDGQRLVTFAKAHADQRGVLRQIRDQRGGDWDANRGGRFRAVRCGRRWGKTELGKSWAGAGAVKGEEIGWFAPSHKILRPAFNQMKEALGPLVIQSSANEVITTVNGRIDFWSTDNEDAGRSRRYHRVVIDEAAFTKANMIEVWKRAIKPTLLDFGGRVLVTSNTNGIDPDNFMWQICNQPEHGFIEYHAPSWNNPYVPMRKPWMSREEYLVARQAEFESIRRSEPPLIFQQEYAAEFVDFSGMAFLSQDKLLVDGHGIETPSRCDAVFATIDTAIKTGKKNDGTAVCYWARNKIIGQPLILLDWDVIQIQGDLLDTWLKTVFENLEHWAKRCGARFGSLGAHIEEKASGIVLIQAAQRKGWPAHAIPGVLTSLGKDERAISISGYHHRGEIKITAEAHTKTTEYKNQTANHLIKQVCGFRIGVPNQVDDALDAYCYGVSIALGNLEGI